MFPGAYRWQKPGYSFKAHDKLLLDPPVFYIHEESEEKGIKPEQLHVSGQALRAHIINAMEPHVEVTVIGDRTFGKPVGQVGLELCGIVLRLTAFRTVNADGVGDYFEGLPADCPVNDDLTVPVGDDEDPNMLAAMSYLATGACPAAPAMQMRVRDKDDAGRKQEELRGPPWREFAGAY